jgi:hypothetical protein
MAYTQNKAIMFAEWLSENEWIKRKQGQTHPNKVGKYYSHIQCEYKPIEELYDLFENSEGKNIIESSEPHLPLGDVSWRSEQLKCDVCGSNDLRSHSEGLICGDCNYVMLAF